MAEQQEILLQDRQLVADVLANRDGAFTVLVERYQRLVWHLVFRMVQHPEDCRELSQEVFLRVHRYVRQFRFDSSLATWIGRIAYHVSLRHLQRRQIPVITQQDDEISPIEQVTDDFDLAAACANQQLMAKLHQAMTELSPLSRTVLTLYYLEELSVGDIATITERPEGTIKNALFRARQQLREQCEKMGVFDE